MIYYAGKRLSSDNKPLPRMIFFDTSNEEEDININQKLIEIIGEYSQSVLSLVSLMTNGAVSEGSESRLPNPGAEEILVTLSFIKANGDVYVRKQNEDSEQQSEVKNSAIDKQKYDKNYVRSHQKET